MQACGISGNLYLWLSDYLADRKQFVQIDYAKSDLHNVEFGVPQGSALGPRLFAMKVMDLPECHSTGYIKMFADDTECFCIGDSVDNVTSSLQLLLDDIHTWCRTNFLTVHPEKSEILILNRKKLVGPLQGVFLNKKPINYVVKSKCLGMTLDDKVSWKNHVQNVSKCLGQKIKSLRRLKGLAPSVLENIYFKGLLPSAIYGLVVWGLCSNNVLSSLERVHRRAAKLIHNIPTSIPENQILDKAKWKDIKYLYKRRVACLTHKAYYGETPEEIKFLIKKSETKRSLRDNLKIELPRSRTELGKRSFKHHAAIILNSLPTEMKRSSSMYSFKNRIKENSLALDRIDFGSTVTLSNKDISMFFYY